MTIGSDICSEIDGVPCKFKLWNCIIMSVVVHRSIQGRTPAVLWRRG